MRVSVKFEGGQDLSRALATLGDESTVAGRRSLRTTANELRDALRESAPRGDGPTKKTKRLKSGGSASYDYGRLKDNIRVTESRARKDNTIVMKVSTGNAFWGRFLEFGTVNMRARPWMRPVFDRMQNVLVASLGKQLGIQIERAAKRIARGTLANGRNG